MSCIVVLEAAGAVLSIVELAVVGETAAIEASVGNGADIQMVDKDRLSVLHDAALNGHESCIQTLVKLGANMNSRASKYSNHYSRMHGCRVESGLLVGGGHVPRLSAGCLPRGQQLPRGALSHQLFDGGAAVQARCHEALRRPQRCRCRRREVRAARQGR